MHISVIEPQKFYTARDGEKKIGEKIQYIKNAEEIEQYLRNSHAQYALIGIPEDIGVRANFGRAGAYSAFHALLKSFLSMQTNRYLNAENILLVGEVQVKDLMLQSENLNPKNKHDLKELRKLVETIDARVYDIIKLIFQYNKIPIVIGGGHNNAFPLIQGAQHILKEKIGIINCDAHSDLRTTEGRHSGNAFRYAFENDLIAHYHILGLHEQYTSEEIYQYMKCHAVTFYTYEDIFVREKISFDEALKNSMDLMKHYTCGIELDLDAITNVPSSARTSSGISPIQARKYIYSCANNLNCVYLHLAEGAPETAHLRADYKTGKLLAYLICDFIKGTNEKHYENA